MAELYENNIEMHLFHTGVSKYLRWDSGNNIIAMDVKSVLGLSTQDGEWRLTISVNSTGIPNLLESFEIFTSEIVLSENGSQICSLNQAHASIFLSNAVTAGDGEECIFETLLLYINACLRPNRNCVDVAKNTASGNGGGMAFSMYSSLSLNGATIRSNSARGRGGGMYIYESFSTSTLSSHLLD